jgi:histidyl-tRNA synthetase
MSTFRTVKGFRDFFPEECALRNYIAETWRVVARRYGFVEYEAPVVESTDLFRKKSGNEITAQLFCFRDKADREITLRPEVTPSLARMATARQRDFKKPIKWFQIGPCFRYEEPQEGRGREFIQFNADVLGDSGPATAAELIALAIDTMREFGVSADDFVIRLSNREIWNGFLAEKTIAAEHINTFLAIIDKIERNKPEDTEKNLAALGLTTAAVREFMTSTDENHPAASGSTSASMPPSCAASPTTPASFSRSSISNTASAPSPAAALTTSSAPSSAMETSICPPQASPWAMSCSASCSSARPERR